MNKLGINPTEATDQVCSKSTAAQNERVLRYNQIHSPLGHFINGRDVSAFDPNQEIAYQLGRSLYDYTSDGYGSNGFLDPMLTARSDMDEDNLKRSMWLATRKRMATQDALEDAFVGDPYDAYNARMATRLQNLNTRMPTRELNIPMPTRDLNVRMPTRDLNIRMPTRDVDVRMPTRSHSNSDQPEIRMPTRDVIKMAALNDLDANDVRPLPPNRNPMFRMNENDIRMATRSRENSYSNKNEYDFGTDDDFVDETNDSQARLERMPTRESDTFIPSRSVRAMWLPSRSLRRQWNFYDKKQND